MDKRLAEARRAAPGDAVARTLALRPGADDKIEEVKRFYGIENFSGRREDAEARRVCVYLIIEEAGLSLGEIGGIFVCAYPRIEEIRKHLRAEPANRQTRPHGSMAVAVTTCPLFFPPC